MERLEQDSCSVLVNNPPSDTDVTYYSCVTSEDDRTKGLVASSDYLRKDSESAEKSSKKRAIEHDEADTRIIEVGTSSSGESFEGRESSVSSNSQTPVTTAGQANDCVRTVAETSPMPDLFAQDDDGDT